MDPAARDETGKLIPIDVRAGDRILFGKWSGTEVKIGGVEYLIMKERDIMGVLVKGRGQEEGRLIALSPNSRPEETAKRFSSKAEKNIGSIILIVRARLAIVPEMSSNKKEC